MKPTVVRMPPRRRGRPPLLLVTALVVVVGAACGTSTVPSSSPASTAAVGTTAGWVVHVYGRTAISVPRTWTIANEPLCPPLTTEGLLTLGIHPGPLVVSCPADTSIDPRSVTVVPLAEARADGQPPDPLRCGTVTVNHLRIDVGPCSSSDTVWTIPALDVELVGSGGGAGATPGGVPTVVDRVLHTVHRATAVEVATRSPLVVHLRVARTRVTAGVPIRATVTLSNTTGEDIVVDLCAADGWLDVGLSGHGIHFAPVNTAIACAPTVFLRPGTNSFAETISTAYGQCSESAVSGPDVVACTATGPPPLPAGAYRTDVIAAGLPDDTVPADVTTVYLTR